MMYITCSNVPIPIGVQKKIQAQTKVFDRYYGCAMFGYCHYGMMYLSKNGENIEKDFAVTDEEKFNLYLKWIKKYGVSKVFIRAKIPLNVFLLAFLRELKKLSIVVVYEIPSWPLDSLIKNPDVMFEEQYNQVELKKYVSLVTTYININEIYGIPVCTLQNGVDLETLPLRKRRERKKTICLMMVALMEPWQGLERLIEGMYDYCKHDGAYDIKFFFVGEGSGIPYWKKLVKELNLINNVKFYGQKIGRELNELYDIVDMGIGCLGSYKLGFKQGASIKVREYCARGLPFIYGYDDIGFTGNEIFCKRVSNDSSPIDMHDIIELYEKTVERQDIIDTMRDYASKHLTWDVILKPVLKYYDEACNLRMN